MSDFYQKLNYRIKLALLPGIFKKYYLFIVSTTIIFLCLGLVHNHMHEFHNIIKVRMVLKPNDTNLFNDYVKTFEEEKKKLDFITLGRKETNKLQHFFDYERISFNPFFKKNGGKIVWRTQTSVNYREIIGKLNSNIIDILKQKKEYTHTKLDERIILAPAQIAVSDRPLRRVIIYTFAGIFLGVLLSIYIYVSRDVSLKVKE